MKGNTRKKGNHMHTEFNFDHTNLSAVSPTHNCGGKVRDSLHVSISIQYQSKALKNTLALSTRSEGSDSTGST